MNEFLQLFGALVAAGATATAAYVGHPDSSQRVIYHACRYPLTSAGEIFMNEFLQLFGVLVAAGATATAAYVGAHAIIKVRHSWRLSNVAIEQEQAEAKRIRAETYATKLRASFAETTTGGTVTIYDPERGIAIPGKINALVPNHFAQQITYPAAPAVLTATDPASLPSAAIIPAQVDLYAALTAAQPDPATFEIVLGATATGYELRPFGADMLHFGLLGASGSGKSSEAQATLFQLALADPTARRVKFGFLDIEGKTSKPFKAAPHTLFIADDPEGVGAALEAIEAEMSARQGLDDDQLDTLPMWAIMIEEYLSLRDEVSKDDWARLVRIATRARKSRIYLICASQAFYASEDTRIIRGQLRTRAAFAVEDAGTLTAFGIKDTSAHAAILKEPKPGRFLLRTPGGMIVAQAPYISPAQIARHFAGNTVQSASPSDVYATNNARTTRHPAPATRQHRRSSLHRPACRQHPTRESNAPSCATDPV